ncbi:hypothetical protein RvY_16351-2 [Ramazzottius varieornatus]|uniref:Globin domain-containing protein n=1 Tax=Ramazzottius varieornatus TaxID=947166 RepID=A0A1D1VY61_RAMVA|nr:hypothetical protein RvY_16351-2 [Ramazzottius varieornatus]
MDQVTLKADLDALTTAQNVSMEEINPVTGLTTRERLLVQRSWQELLKLGRSTVGIEIFDRYFTMFPQYIQAFKKFRDIPVEKLKSHPRLKAHGTTVLK